MGFSIWEYIRGRTRDAVLAGIQDAMDIAEQDDTNGSQHAAASQLTSRLGTPQLKQLPSASMNGEATAEIPPVMTSEPAEAPTRPADASPFDDELERRLESAGPQATAQSDGAGRETPPVTTRRKRGRPPKSESR